MIAELNQYFSYSIALSKLKLVFELTWVYTNYLQNFLCQSLYFQWVMSSAHASWNSLVNHFWPDEGNIWPSHWNNEKYSEYLKSITILSL